MMRALAIDALLMRYDRLTLRERLFIAAALLAVVLGLWNLLLMAPLDARRSAALASIDQLQAQTAATADAMAAARDADSGFALARELAAQGAALAAVDRQLASTAIGLVAPERMPRLIGDLIRRRGTLRLVSLRNRPVRTLLGTGELTADAAPTAGTGPFVHTVEVVVTGRYLDLLGFLRALEALPWRFYWNGLDLQVEQFPLNRARIEISTLSMESSWLGV